MRGNTHAAILCGNGPDPNVHAMTGILRTALCAALVVTACRRPTAEESPAWERNPGLDPRPAGQTTDGKKFPPVADVSFRLSPEPETASTAGGQVIAEEDELYLRAARSGQAWAQTKLGMKYVMRDHDLARMGEGLHWLNAAADQNDTDALRVLAALAMQGRGVDQSEKEALKYLRRAAELGSPEAQHQLATMLISGQGSPRDAEAAIYWLRKAAGRNFAPAQFMAGRMLIDSVEAERKNEALDYLQRAADAGQIEAVVFLSSALGRGEFGMTKDEAKAEALLLPWAGNGNADCQFALATLYRYGESFANKRSEALDWLRRAADAGNRRAAEILRKTSELPQP